MTEKIELEWMQEWPSLKEALQTTLGSSGQLLKKFYSSKELGLPQHFKQKIALPLDLVNHLQINPQYEGSPARILYESPDYLAVHKPPGVHAHPLKYSDKDTILNFLIQEQRWAPLHVNTQHYDRGLLYRLDYETSGVLLLAKNEKLWKEMRQGFHEEMKKKLYWAIVEGDFDQEGNFVHYFRATGLKGSKQVVDLRPHEGAQAGHFRVRKVQEHNGKSLLLINLKTGLRHQIRAQLSALGFPILGDELYGGRKASRLYLHALRYEWCDVIEDPLPELFESFFDLNRALQMTHDMIRLI